MNKKEDPRDGDWIRMRFESAIVFSWILKVDSRWKLGTELCLNDLVRCRKGEGETGEWWIHIDELPRLHCICESIRKQKRPDGFSPASRTKTATFKKVYELLEMRKWERTPKKDENSSSS